MDPPSRPGPIGLKRSDSVSQTSEASHTAQDYIASQLSLEADAREALPYQFDTCTKPLGPLRQSVYACLTCSPPPASPYQQYTPAGVCYSCSISCHGEHNLVELFSKRDFVCDCGTTRFSNSATPCSLRLGAETNRKGGAINEEARVGNKYNQNFEGKFCGCGEEYDPEVEKGTMFQCLGLGAVEDGGCGEDWWHPECLIGLPHKVNGLESKSEPKGALETAKEVNGAEQSDTNEVSADNLKQLDEQPLPPGFPNEDDFEHLICYKCVNAFPWIKSYAGTEGFLTAKPEAIVASHNGEGAIATAPTTSNELANNKRKAEDQTEEHEPKKPKSEPPSASSEPQPDLFPSTAPKHTTLPAPPAGNTPLFLTETFRDTLCRCPTCFPHLRPHPQLLEEEDSYEPPISPTSSEAAADNTAHHPAAPRSTHSQGSLLERGEAALSGMDRVRAIEGVMAYNHVRDKVKDFLKPFAESGQAVGAEDIKEYFAKLRGDEQAQQQAEGGAGGVQGDGRKEQEGR